MTIDVVASGSLLRPTGRPQTYEQDDASEANDRLPSLPSSSSSLFMAVNHGSTGGPSVGASSTASMSSSPSYGSPSKLDLSRPGQRRRRRVASLYGNPSIAASDAVSIEGASTYEYDVVANLQKQQARRRRGDSNASISTVTSILSRQPSVAASVASDAREPRDAVRGHAHGHFISSRSAASSIINGGDATAHDNYTYGSEAAASLRRIRNRNGREGGDAGSTSGAVVAGGAEPHLTDKLEQLIANSASYRSAHARDSTRSRTRGDAPQFDARHRKDSYASLRSLMAFTSTGQRQTSSGAYQQPSSSSSRAASLFGVFLGGNGPRPTDSSMRSPAWSRPPRPSAPTVTSVGAADAFVSPVASPTLSNDNGKRDAVGSLLGLRSLFDVPAPQRFASSPSADRARPALLARSSVSGVAPSSTSSTLFAAASAAAAPRTEQPTADARGKTSSAAADDVQQQQCGERRRQVSFQSSNRPDGSGLLTPSTGTNASGQRAFAVIDPTRGASGSGTATSNSPSPSGSASRTTSHVEVSKLAAVHAEKGEPWHGRQSLSPLPTTPTSPTRGATPALDDALAWAEDRSGLKTSSHCSTCGKRAVNAPVTKSGDVFCRRECRIEMKQRKRKAAAATSKPSSTTSTSASTRSPSLLASAASSISAGHERTASPSAILGASNSHSDFASSSASVARTAAAIAQPV